MLLKQRKQVVYLYARYLCSRDALGLKAEQPLGQARGATIGYLVYKLYTRHPYVLYARYLCSRDARPSARATIGYLVYNLTSRLACRLHRFRPSASREQGYFANK